MSILGFLYVQWIFIYWFIDSLIYLFIYSFIHCSIFLYYTVYLFIFISGGECNQTRVLLCNQTKPTCDIKVVSYRVTIQYYYVIVPLCHHVIVRYGIIVCSLAGFPVCTLPAQVMSFSLSSAKSCSWVMFLYVTLQVRWFWAFMSCATAWQWRTFSHNTPCHMTHTWHISPPVHLEEISSFLGPPQTSPLQSSILCP